MGETTALKASSESAQVCFSEHHHSTSFHDTQSNGTVAKMTSDNRGIPLKATRDRLSVPQGSVESGSKLGDATSSGHHAPKQSPSLPGQTGTGLGLMPRAIILENERVP